MRYFVYDFETGGFSSSECAVLQLGYKIIIDGIEVISRDIRIRPFTGSVVSASALEVNGHRFEDLSDYPPEAEAIAQIMADLTEVKAMYGIEKLILLGYNNISFDDMFLIQLFSRHRICVGDYFDAPETEAKPAQTENVEIDGVEVLDYSEKSFAVVGNTKPIKDKLKELGGRFNFNLTCGAGWVFPLSKREAVNLLLTQNKPQI